MIMGKIEEADERFINRDLPRNVRGTKPMIKEEQIKETASSDAVYDRGCRCFNENAIKNFTAYSANHYAADVLGGQLYQVTVRMINRDKIKRYSCECPAYYQYDGACKHVVALLKRIQQRQREEERSAIRSSTNRLITLFGEAQKESEQAADLPLCLIPTCHLKVHYIKVSAHLEFTVGKTRQYVMRDVEDFITAMLYGQEIVYGKELTVEPGRLRFSPQSRALWELMRDAYEDEQSLKTSMSASKLAVNKQFILSPSYLSRFFEVMQATPFDLVINGVKRPAMRIRKGRPPIKFSLKDDFMNGYLSIGESELLNLDHRFKYILHNHEVIYQVDEAFSRSIKPLIQCFKESKKNEILIEKEHMPEFFGRVMPDLEELAPIRVEPVILQRFDILPLNSEIYFDHEADGIRAKIEFRYGEKAFNPALDGEHPPKAEGKILIRDAAAEKQILAIFESYKFRLENDAYVQADEERVYDFLTSGVPLLAELSDIYYADGFKDKPIRRIDHVAAGIRVADGNMLEMSLAHSDMQLSELLEVLSSYRLKKRYHRLKDGTFVPLESEELSTIANFMEHVAAAAGGKSDVIAIPLAKAVYLDSLAREAKGLKLERSAEFKKIVQDIKEPMDVEVEVPPELAPTLRDYQKTGFKWLTTLARYGLGGILADDMGLGKTLQVIAFLLAEKQSSSLPSLVVTPTSLLYNWIDEVEKFAPSLNARVIAGVKSARQKDLQALEDVDIVITTYNTLKRDIEEYHAIEFKYCILDEAQHIKNPNTKNAKTVKQLRTRGYFALTGTPIENTLTELWSIFDFLMPGYLFSHRDFKARFELPIVKNKDRFAALELRRHIAPFILRRMKSDVLKELPDKIESKMINEMTDAQRKIYIGHFLQAQKEFEAELAARGFLQSRIKILSILTRLRQICCHPSLFLEGYTGGSGKLDMLKEVIEGAMEGGHRLLIFSQFTSMLAIIRREVEAMDLPYYYLDGHTPAIERVQMAKSFNGGEKSVFLISLKAGGTGLNLTGADMVIHYDPWWNPAVEEQATDRAYRLGQNSRVQVFKFITKDTIEEKIFALQQMKKALIDQMIQPGENFLSKLSEEELRNLFTL